MSGVPFLERLQRKMECLGVGVRGLGERLIHHVFKHGDKRFSFGLRDVDIYEGLIPTLWDEDGNHI